MTPAITLLLLGQAAAISDFYERAKLALLTPAELSQMEQPYDLQLAECTEENQYFCRPKEDKCCDIVAAGGYQYSEPSSTLGLQHDRNNLRYAPIYSNIVLNSQPTDGSSCFGNGGGWLSRYNTGLSYLNAGVVDADKEYIEFGFDEPQQVDKVMLQGFAKYTVDFDPGCNVPGSPDNLDTMRSIPAGVKISWSDNQDWYSHWES